MLKIQLMQGSLTKGLEGRQDVVALILQGMIFIVMLFLEELTKQLPGLIEHLKKRFAQKAVDSCLNTVKEENLRTRSVQLNGKHKTNTVVFTRTWDDKTKEVTTGTADIVDAIIAHVSSLHNIPTLQLISSSQYLISFTERPVEIFKDIFLSVKSFNMNAETLRMSSLVFNLLSDVHSTREIKDAVEEIRQKYVADMQNQLGDGIWFFDHRTQASRCPPPTDDPTRAKLERILSAPKEVQYEMRKFHSNKTFDNLYGSQANAIQKRLDFFLEHPDWYARKGLPYQLGMLLSGTPGSGKTSIIRAVANRTGRHIFNLKVSDIATSTQLKNIFFNENVRVISTDGDVRSLYIPLNRRLYVLEELDTVGTLVLDRAQGLNIPSHVLADELCLGDILQILDGTVEIPGRLLIVTSNHPERLDRALTRPGRLDVKVKFGNVSAECTREIIGGLLGISITPDRLPHDKLTVAEVMSILLEFDPSSASECEEGVIITRLFERAEELAHDEGSRVDRSQNVTLHDAADFHVVEATTPGVGKETAGTDQLRVGAPNVTLPSKSDAEKLPLSNWPSMEGTGEQKTFNPAPNGVLDGFGGFAAFQESVPSR